MASRRRFRAPIVPLGVTKGHSILKQRSYSPAFHRRPVAFDDVYTDYPYPYVPKKHYIDTGSEENFLRSEVNRELFLTAAAMEDNYDLAAASRKRDDEIMSNVNRAIAASETHTSPRAAVASTRANRPHAQPVIVAPVVYSAPSSRPTATRSKKEIEYPHKAIRDVEGFTKPKNILSWQYRLQARISPDALLYEPRSFVTMRDQVRDVKDKMDRQRQLLDRYLPADSALDEEVRAARSPRL